MKIVITFFSIFGLLLVSVIASGSAFLKRQIDTTPDGLLRMAHIRLLPKDMRSALVRDYAARLPSNSDVILLGDSQTFGVSLTSGDSLGAHLRDAALPNVYNMAIVDGRFSDQLNIIKILKSEKKRAKYIFININPAHFKRGLIDPRHLPDALGYSMMFSLISTTAPGIYAPFWKIPTIDLPIVKNKATSIYDFDIYDNQYQEPTPFVEARQPKDYLMNLDSAAGKDLVEVLIAATGIADRVIAYAAPTSYAIYNSEKYRWNWDTTPLIRSALEQCRTIKRVTCEDLSDAVPAQHFIDVLHLRPDGQKVLASSLHRLIDLHQFRSSRKDNL